MKQTLTLEFDTETRLINYVSGDVELMELILTAFMAANSFLGGSSGSILDQDEGPGRSVLHHVYEGQSVSQEDADVPTKKGTILLPE